MTETDWATVDIQSGDDSARNVKAIGRRTVVERPETAAAITRGIHSRLNISQAEFAARFQVPVGTFRDWEQNRKLPDANALTYLGMIAVEPHTIARLLNARLHKAFDAPLARSEPAHWRHLC